MVTDTSDLETVTGNVIESTSSFLGSITAQQEDFTVTEPRYFRSDSHDVNGLTGDILGTQQSNNVDDSSETVEGDNDDGDLQVDWGVEFQILEEDGTTRDFIAEDQPVAIVSRGPDDGGEGIQSETFQMPEEELEPEESLYAQVYIRVEGNGWQEIDSAHITEQLEASRILESEVEVFYYTDREFDDGGPPPSRFTTGTFYWGDPEFNSRIEGLSYEEARVEAEQTNPSQDTDTYPTEEIDHSVELTCRAGSCSDIEAVPQACQGSTCTDFQDVEDLTDFGIEWRENSLIVDNLERGESTEETIVADVEEEGEYRIRYDIRPSNVQGDTTIDYLISSEVSNPELISFTHQNLQEQGIDEYEAGDTIEFIETELQAFDGKAFNLRISPKIDNPDGVPVEWGPEQIKGYEDVEEGETLEEVFNDYTIPSEQDEGEYTFRIDFDWENFGPGSNQENTFNLVNLRQNFNSSLDEETIFQGETTNYEFEFENRWSEEITNVDVNINCPSELNCQSTTTDQFGSVGPGQEEVVVFEIDSEDSTQVGEYDINTTIQYENPNDLRIWEEVENQELQVSAEDGLLTDILDDPEPLPDEITRNQLRELRGSVTNPDDPANDVTLEWILPDSWNIEEGEALKQIGDLETDETDYNNITSDITLNADRGEQFIELRSNESTGERGEATTETINVFADTSIDLALDPTKASHGQEIEADISLNLDTGAVLEDQRVVLRNTDQNEILATGDTDGNGELTISFDVEEEWDVGENQILAEYEQNDSIYTRSSQDAEDLRVSDIPEFQDITEEPDPAGMGLPVTINTTVDSEDELEEVTATVQTPSGDELDYILEDQGGSVYEFIFDETLENGIFDYNLTAKTVEGFENRDTGNSFEAGGNATKTVITDKDTYGPYEEVLLDRQDDVSEDLNSRFSTLTKEISSETIVSEAFSTDSGTSGIHTNTHELDGEIFEMEEAGGSPPDTPDEFEGSYTYETVLENPSEIEINSFGSVTGGTWEVSALNHDTGDYETVFEISETEDTWYNETVCGGIGCEDYVQNNEIEIRVFTQSDRGTDTFVYGVDYQEIDLSTDDGPITAEQDYEQLEIGQTSNSRNRFYSRFDRNDLPIANNMEVQDASMVFTVEEGLGTGEINHVERFDEQSNPENVHDTEEPDEATQVNPVASFDVNEGEEYEIDITQAFEESIEAGVDPAFQVKEEDEFTPFELDAEPVIRVNYTADPLLVNTGELDINAFLDLRVQRYENNEWQTVGFPQVTPADGRYRVNESDSLDLSTVWQDSDGFNTQAREAGLYRIRSSYVDSNTQMLVTDTGEPINDSYEFEIEDAELELTEITHENLFENSLNEFETTDNIGFINVTVENNQSTAANATANLNVLDELGQQVGWGPDSKKEYGDIEAGENKTRRWDNDDLGYTIPEDASTGTFEFDWNTTLEADNFETEQDHSFSFILHNVRDEFESLINTDQNRVFRNESALYNFSLTNPWSQPLEDVQIEVNCDETEIGCEGVSSGSKTESIGQLDPGEEAEIDFNLTTDQDTEIKDYDINATVSYQNPGNENKMWEEVENEVLRVRLPGSLINVTEAPEKVTRGDSGYRFESYTNNTFEEDLTDVSTTWVLPEEWNNQTGTLEEFEDVQETGELIWNNFTAELTEDAEIGEQGVEKQARNDQGREDDFTQVVEVFADTELFLNVNNTEPAVNETILISGSLELDNGTAVSSEPVTLRDEELDEEISTEVTGANGEFSTEYKLTDPEGLRTLNSTYEGSEEIYTNSDFTEQQIEVTGTPEIIRLDEIPSIQGFGKNITLEAELAGDEDINAVEADIDQPNGTLVTKTMIEVGQDIYRANFSGFQEGTHDYTVIATNEAGNQGEEDSSFVIDVEEISTIQTREEEYLPGDEVELTEIQGSWWNTDWEYRQRIEIEETAGEQLERYPVEITLDNLGEKTDSCEDLRAIQNLETRDIYIEDCNPDGETVIQTEVDIGSLETTEIFLYYGNQEVADYGQEAYAFNIDDQGSVSRSTSLSVTDRYNDGNALFRNIEITVSGDDLQATVTPYNYETQEYEEPLFDGPAADGEVIVDETYFDNPVYSELDIDLEDTSNNPSEVEYTYDYSTPENIQSQNLEEDDKLPSLIENIGETEFEGRINLQVQELIDGEWETDSQQFIDADTRDITSENLGTIWNQDPWVIEDTGIYRVWFGLLDPEDRLLQSSEGDITANYEFNVGDPPTEVQVDQIEIYNVTDSADRQDDTSNLVDSGTNDTFRLPENNDYRFDINLLNEESAEDDWEITSEDMIRHLGFDDTWNVETTEEIFYENETQRYQGGTYDGTVEWDTQGGTVSPGDTARFSFVIDIPEGVDKRDILFELDDLRFDESDESRLEVVEADDIPPEPLEFQINDSLRRGESGFAYAEWDTDIDASEAEYDIVDQDVLTNFTVEPEGKFTNYTFETDEDWFRGEHQFRFYATDFAGNTNSTWIEYFDIFGTAEIQVFEVNPQEPETGEETVLECRVQDNFGNSIGGYNVEFYDEEELLETTTTNSTGWANTTYSSQEVGEETLFCVINEDISEYYLTPGDSSSQTVSEEIFVRDPDAPEYQDFGSNLTRIFKTDQNSMGRFFSEWVDSSELDSSSLTFGDYEIENEILPESSFELENLEGEQDTAEFNVTPPADTQPQNTTWNIHANDTSGNINTTDDIDVDIWAWSLFDTEESGLESNPIEDGDEANFQCRVVQGNGSGISNYPVEFYDNETGTMELVGTNETNLNGVIEFSKIYENTGTYNLSCQIQDRNGDNIQVLQDEEEFSELLSVQDQLTAPEIVDDNYFLNTTQVFIEEDILGTFAKWDRSIESASVRYNFTDSSGKVQEEIKEPYTNNWTNTTLEPNSTWDTGNYGVKTVAESDEGGVNDTLNFQMFEVFSRSEVEWLEPEEASIGEETLVCSVEDISRDEVIEDYSVEFYDENANLMGVNETDTDGKAELTIDTSDRDAGELAEHTCRINDEEQLYYETGDQDSDSQVLEFGDEMNTTITNPENGTVFETGEVIDLESVSQDSSGDLITPENVTWYQDDEEIAEGENTTYEVEGSSGLAEIRVEAEKDSFTTGEDTILIDIDGDDGRLEGDLLEPANETLLAQNKTFEANVSVTCKEEDCGEVNTTLRYNQTGDSADTEVSEDEGDKPFYTLGSNEKSCGILNQGDQCNTLWEVNATGSRGSVHALDVEMGGETAVVNDTEDIHVQIEEILILNVDYGEINFGSGDPDDSLQAENNTEGYDVFLDDNSNDATDGVWQNMSRLEHTTREPTDEDGENTIIEPERTSWDETSTCVEEDSRSFSTGFVQVKDYLSSDETFSQCFFQEIPFSKYEGDYEGTLTIKVNSTN